MGLLTGGHYWLCVLICDTHLTSPIELLENVELRFALADTNERFEKSVGTFLVPVLVKLDSPHDAVRNKVLC